MIDHEPTIFFYNLKTQFYNEIFFKKLMFLQETEIESRYDSKVL